MNDLLISCEHGGYRIPDAYKKQFESYGAKLATHKGWDPGALELSKLFHKNLKSTFHYSTVSRLLIELNRTIEHPELFSPISSKFTDIQKRKLKEEIYMPYLNLLDTTINSVTKQKKPISHLSIHSFTPTLDGVKRDAEIGILFDPKNSEEEKYATLWMESILINKPQWRIKFNYPYLGTDDGLTSYFRAKYPKDYLGIELEVNNQLFNNYTFEHLAKILMPPRG